MIVRLMLSALFIAYNICLQSMAPSIYHTEPATSGHQKSEHITLPIGSIFHIDVAQVPQAKFEWNEPEIVQKPIVLGLADKLFDTRKKATRYTFKGFEKGHATIRLEQRDSSKRDNPVVATHSIDITVTAPQLKRSQNQPKK